VLPPGGYGTTIVTRLSGNAALQENAASARLHTKKMLTTQSLKDALSGNFKDVVENTFEETRNRGMIFSLKKTRFGGQEGLKRLDTLFQSLTKSSTYSIHNFFRLLPLRVSNCGTSV
jgi:hypothetical protein